MPRGAGRRRLFPFSSLLRNSSEMLVVVVLEPDASDGGAAGAGAVAGSC